MKGGAMSDLMPKGFILPNGKAISTKAFVHSWKTLKTLPPNEMVNGWNWFATNARWILKAISDGVHDRVNRRGGLVVRELTETRLFKLKARHK